MSVDTGSVCTESDLSTVRRLRIEVADLSHALGLAKEAASRCAVMLREGDHRIKNSLQIVSSLIKMQAGREESLTAREALRTAAARIQSVARMHDALQASGGADSLDLGAVLEKMCGALEEMGGAPLGVHVRVSADPVQAPVAVAQPIVLAVNELVVNALRHAFPDGRTGSIHVKLWCAEGQLHVLVADDGVGLPAGHSESGGYGMKLVRMMTAQINGVLHVDSGAGTRITIVLPEPQTVAAAPTKAAPAPTPDRAPAKSAKEMRRPLVSAFLRTPWSAHGRG
jgi:two-component sensor histidine kinase